jgi:hypothetical protein
VPELAQGLKGWVGGWVGRANTHTHVHEHCLYSALANIHNTAVHKRTHARHMTHPLLAQPLKEVGDYSGASTVQPA